MSLITFFTYIWIKDKEYFSRQWSIGQCILFIIPVVIDLHEQGFEAYTMVSEIHYNVDIALGIRNVYELEGVINTRESCLHFLSRSIPFFPKTEVFLKPREQWFINIEMTFIDVISWLAIIKPLDFEAGKTRTTKVKFFRHTGFLDVTNNSSKQLILYWGLCIMLCGPKIYWIL